MLTKMNLFFTSFASFSLGENSVWHDKGVVFIFRDEDVWYIFGVLVEKGTIFGLVVEQSSLSELISSRLYH